MKKEICINFAIFGAVVIFVLFSFLQYKSSQNLTVFEVVPNESRMTASNTVSTELTVSEVGQHDSASDCWLIVSDKVYDATSYLSIHPRAGQLVVPYCGQDATTEFLAEPKHNNRAMSDLTTLYIGDLGSRYIPN